MLEKLLEINIEPGLQARPAAQFVQKANHFISDVQIEKENKKINAKSIMGLMSLALSKGSKIKLIVNGEDEEAAMTELEKFILNKG